MNVGTEQENRCKQAKLLCITKCLITGGVGGRRRKDCAHGSGLLLKCPVHGIHTTLRGRHQGNRQWSQNHCSYEWDSPKFILRSCISIQRSSIFIYNTVGQLVCKHYWHKSIYIYIWNLELRPFKLSYTFLEFYLIPIWTLSYIMMQRFQDW